MCIGDKLITFSISFSFNPAWQDRPPSRRRTTGRRQSPHRRLHHPELGGRRPADVGREHAPPRSNQVQQSRVSKAATQGQRKYRIM